jgi:hypothetical protein
MALLDVVFRMLDKAGDTFIEPRREDGHGATAALPTNVADSGEREYTHVVATVTASGATTVYTPATGKRVRLRWAYAINDPSSDTSPLIKVLLGAEEKYRVFALSKRQVVTGPVDGALIIDLSAAAQVAVTVLLEEV